MGARRRETKARRGLTADHLEDLVIGSGNRLRSERAVRQAWAEAREELLDEFLAGAGAPPAAAEWIEIDADIVRAIVAWYGQRALLDGDADQLAALNAIEVAIDGASTFADLAERFGWDDDPRRACEA